MKSCFICGRQNCICRQELNFARIVYDSHNLNYKRKKVKLIKNNLK